MSDWIIDAGELLSEPDPGPTRWLVSDLVVDQALVAVVGRWKTTKSYGMLDICIATATGRPAFGVLDVPREGPVVFVNEESGRAALWRRLDALCRGRGIDPKELKDHLFVAPNAGVKLDDDDWQERLLELGARIEPRLFVFDPLARMKGASRDESSQADMAAVVEFWRRLREDTGAAVALVHHTGHTGEHMRGSSDLETVWETRLQWKRDGQSPVVTIESEHREAEPGAPFQYRIAWEVLTRSMRFEAVEDPHFARVRGFLEENPQASGNDAVTALGKRARTLSYVKAIRHQGGTDSLVPPRYHPSEPTVGSGTADGPSKGPPYHPPAEASEPVPTQSYHPSKNGRPLLGDEGFLEHLFGALEAGQITEGEWRQAEGAHRLVVMDDLDVRGVLT